MAKIDENLMMNKARGNVGKQFVFKQRGETTHIARMPRKNKNAVITAKQETVRDLFSAAAMFAQGVTADPDLKVEYEKKVTSGTTAYNVAFRDYLKSPKVLSINPEFYDGSAGSIITVVAKDDFRVARVVVKIRTAAGVVLETGDATLNPIKREKWQYVASQANATLTGTKIEATAYDIPENKGVLEITL